MGGGFGACRNLDSKKENFVPFIQNLLSLPIWELAIQFLQARQAWGLSFGQSGLGSIPPKDELLVCRLLDRLINLLKNL